MKPGTVVGESYQLVREIGEGATCIVFEAVNTWTKRRVAIKIHTIPMGVESNGRKRFVREAQTSARLTHQHIVRILDLGVDDGGLMFIVQELVKGESLHQCIARLRRLSCTTTIKIFDPILDALALAHDHGIVHRDVTPNNILLAEHAGGYLVPKLTDFGLAKDLAERASTRITASGALLGTPLFMSPEQIRGDVSIDARSDIWGAGATMYKAVTGRPPFEAPSLVELAARIMMSSVPPPSDVSARIPPDFEAVLMRALEKKPEDRYQTAQEFRAALRNYVIEQRNAARKKQRSHPGEECVAESLDRAPVAGGPAAGEITQAVKALRAASLARPLRVGLVVHDDTQTLHLEEAFSSALGIRCDVWRFFKYAELVDAIGEREVEFAWLPPVAYVRARRSGSAQLLLAVERAGQTSFSAALLARPGSIRTLDDLASTKAVWVDTWSAAGYLMPIAMLRAQGLTPSTLFSSQAFVGSHDAVLSCLRAGTADVGGTHCAVDEKGRLTLKPWTDDDNFTLLATGGPIPGDTVCATAGLSKELTSLVVEALLAPKASPAITKIFGGTRMVRVDPCAYDMLESALLPVPR